jgi:hypothetical protein
MDIIELIDSQGTGDVKILLSVMREICLGDFKVGAKSLVGGPVPGFCMLLEKEAFVQDYLSDVSDVDSSPGPGLRVSEHLQLKRVPPARSRLVGDLVEVQLRRDQPIPHTLPVRRVLLPVHGPKMPDHLMVVLH